MCAATLGTTKQYRREIRLREELGSLAPSATLQRKAIGPAGLHMGCGGAHFPGCAHHELNSGPRGKDHARCESIHRL